MTDELIEAVALALVNRDQERFDLPRIETIADFRREDDAAEYIANARAAIRVIAPAVLEQAARRAAETNANCYGDPTDVYETMIDAIRALKEGYSHDQ